MTSEPQKNVSSPSRRDVLRTGGVVIATGAVASALPSSAMFEGEVDQAVDPSGLAVQVLKSKAYDGFLRLTATMLFGAKKARGTSLVRVLSA